MPRMTFTQSLFGVVALTALVGTGCDQWLKALAEAQAQSNGDSTGKGTGGPSMGTGGAPANAGSAGAPGAAVSCKAVVNASGATCKECVDANGAIVYEACDPVPAGSGGTGGSGPATNPGACLTLSDGGPTSCKDAATWMKYGAQACAQKNLTLTDLKPVTTCAGGNYESVTYVCCGSAPPSDAGNDGAGHHVRPDAGRRRRRLSDLHRPDREGREDRLPRRIARLGLGRLRWLDRNRRRRLYVDR